MIPTSSTSSHRIGRAVVLIALAWAALHVPKLGLPPLGRDSWRESDGLIVGRNFCEEHTPLWLPRVDARGDTSGITGMELPILNWLEGHAACVGLPQVIVARTLTLCFSIVAILCVGALAGRRWSWLAALFFATSPLVWYYGTAIQPDMPAVALLLAALVVLRHALRDGPRTGWMLCSAALTGLGGLIKLPVLLLGLPAIVMLVEALGGRAMVRNVRVWLYGAIAILPSLVWYHWARTLQDRYGLHTFFLGQPLRETVAGWLRPAFYQQVFVQKLFDVYAFPAVSAVAILTLLLRWRACSIVLRALAVASLAFVFLCGHHIEHHYYYGLPLVPVLALAATRGCEIELERFRSRVLAWATVVIAVAAAWFGPMRTSGWWARPEDETAYRDARRLIDADWPPNARAVVFSDGSPRLFWQLHRRGWQAPPTNAAQWFSTQPFLSGRPTPFLAIDLRAPRIDQARSELAVAFQAAGYRPVHRNAAVEIWARR